MNKLLSRTRFGCTFFLALILAPAASLVRAQAFPPVTAERPGISALAPVQSFPVNPGEARNAIPERALDPIDDDPLATRSDDAVHVDSGDLLYRPWADGYGSARTPVAGMHFTLRPGASLRLGRADDARRWLAGVGNFTYQEGGLARISVGQVADPVAFWGAAPRLGGVQVARLPTVTSRGTLLPGEFGMTTALGFVALQEMSDLTPSSRLAYGSPMGSGSFMFGLTRDLTIESRMQAGMESAAAGLGGTCAVSDWGTLRLSATQMQEGEVPVLSSGLGMQVRWEDHALESSYQSLRTGGITTGQRVGVNHNWSVSPRLRLQMGADRDLASGGYALRVHVSVPIDAIGTFWSR